MVPQYTENCSTSYQLHKGEYTQSKQPYADACCHWSSAMTWWSSTNRNCAYILQIAPSMRAHALLPRVSGRVAVTHVNMSGRMLIGLHLFSRAPGIKGVDMSFIHPPEVDMKFSPFGMTITEIPGILTALKVRALHSNVLVCPSAKTILHLRKIHTSGHTLSFAVLACMHAWSSGLHNQSMLDV